MRVQKLLTSVLSWCVLLIGISHIGLINTFATGDDIVSTNISYDLLKKAEKTSVAIRASVSHSINNSGVGNWNGSGVIVDKYEGLILTNAHMVGYDGAIGKYIATFYNGKTIEAKLLYVNPIRDFAILKYDTQIVVPDTIEAVEFATKPQHGQSVFTISNSEAKQFSFHHGYLSDIYAVDGMLPMHSYIVNSNTKPGSSGSAVLDMQGKLLGLTYAGGDGYSIALNIGYVIDAIKQIQSGKIVQVNTLGIICNTMPIDDAVKFRGLDPKIAGKYINSFPEMRGKVLEVVSLVPGYNGIKHLKVGDIIWRINDNPVKTGANLYELDSAIDNAKNGKISLNIVRGGQQFKLHLSTMPVKNIERMIEFAGITVCESQYLDSFSTGVAPGSVFITSYKRNSPLRFCGHEAIERNIYRWMGSSDTDVRLLVRSIGGHKIESLNDVMTILPSIINQDHITLECIDYSAYLAKFEKKFVNGRRSVLINLTLDPVNQKYNIFERDNKKLEWVDVTDQYKQSTIPNKQTVVKK